MSEGKARPRWNTRWVEVTPEQAKDILDNWNKANRRVRQATKKKIRRSVEADGWRSLEPLLFAGKFGSSRLLNGQHRLQVLVEMGETQWVQVTEDAPGSMFDNLDQSSNRSMADAISITAEEHGRPSVQNLNVVAALVRMRYAWELHGPGGMGRGVAPSLSEAARLFIAWPESAEYAQRGVALAHRVGAGLGASVAALALYLLEQEYPVEAVKRFEGLVLSRNETEGTPERAVRDAFDEQRRLNLGTGSRLMSPHQQMWTLLTGWSKHRQGLPSSRLEYLTRGGDIPQLPGLPTWRAAA